jgi:cytosine/adenosine deaminase-related metal-dependent hydrolase
VIRPGFVNAHTHLYSALAPLGMPAPSRRPANFVEILGAVWWRLDLALDERSLRAAARLYVAEALLRGTTGIVDHHESPAFIEGSLDVLGDACRDLGMRAVLCYGATERNGGHEEARRGLEECRRFAEAARGPLVRGIVALHASFTVSDDTLREAGALARELGTVVHVHVAEDEADVRDARERGFDGPLEVRMAAERGLWLVQNPRSNENNRVGYARSLAESDRVALGTDGFPSDMREELVHLWRIARANGDPAGELALDDRLEASRTLLAERFAPGALDLDLVHLDTPGPGERPRVHNVTVAGRVVVEDGVLVTGDLEAIRAEARAAAPALWKRMEAITWPS